jgi:hypothetical protein
LTHPKYRKKWRFLQEFEGKNFLKKGWFFDTRKEEQK